MRAAVAAVLVLGVVVPFGVAPRAARAVEGFVGTRPLAMANAGRAWAIGDSALLLNPSGMTLVQAYTIEGSYLFGSAAGGSNFFHASVVDSTSDIHLSGGLSYTYLSDSPGGVGGTAHEGIAALALPLGELVALGASLRYVYATGSERPGSSKSALTPDVGVTVRPTPRASLALVGVNLANATVGNVGPEGGRAIGYAAAFFPIPEVAVALDGVSRVGSDFTGQHRTSVLGGAEATLANRVVLRAGLGYDGPFGTLRGSAGAAVLSEIGAIDVGVQGDLTTSNAEPTRAYVLGVSLRLFVPATTPEQ